MKNSLNPSEETSINPVPSSDETGKILPSGLYLVATPIGNAGDITLRALDVLQRADRIACEDRRVTAPLLRRYGIKTPLTAYHDHNGAVMRPKLLARIRAGEAVALVSDAGTPLISDPGYKLVRAAQNEGLFVTSLPGASAALTALQLSGLPSNRFLVAGFPDAKSSARQTLFRTLAAVPATLIFFEGPSRLVESLTDMAEVFGPRHAALTRELTKYYEEIRRASLTELARHYAEIGPPRGEITLVVAPPEASSAAQEEDLDGLLAAAFEHHSLKEAAELVATATGVARRKVYQRALALKRG